MPRRRPTFPVPLLVAVAAVALTACGVGAAADEGDAPLVLAARIPLPGVEGRIDHLALDAAGPRLFVAALGNDTVEIVDLAKRERVSRLEGLSEPQGVVWLPDLRKLVVTNGGGAAASVFSGEDLADASRVRLRPDPDNARFDPISKRVLIGEGAGRDGALASLNPTKGEVVEVIPLGGHPESFQLEEKGDRAFVNVPSQGAVVVADRKKGEVVGRYRLPAGANFPMALDEAASRLYVATRRPARLYVLDTGTGKIVANLEAPGDVDDLFVDAARRRLYAVAGAGMVRVYRLAEKQPPEGVADVETGAGARTGLFDPDGSRLFVAVPHRGGQTAEIRVYTAK